MPSVVDRIKYAAAIKIAATPGLAKSLLLGGGGLVGGGLLGAAIMRHLDEKEKARAKNIAFGAGAAAGLAGPRIIDAIHGLVHRGDAQ